MSMVLDYETVSLTVLSVAKYKLSSSAFALPLKVTNIVNAVRCSNVSSLPEMCGLLTTPEVGRVFTVWSDTVLLCQLTCCRPNQQKINILCPV